MTNPKSRIQKIVDEISNYALYAVMGQKGGPQIFNNKIPFKIFIVAWVRIMFRKGYQGLYSPFIITLPLDLVNLRTRGTVSEYIGKKIGATQLRI